MKIWHSSFPLFVLVGYFALILTAATSVVADAAKLVAALPATTSEAAPLPAGTEIADLGSMTVTARTGHGAHASGVL